MPSDTSDDHQPPDAVPGDEAQPSNQPIDEMVVSEPLDLSDDVDDEVVEQQNVGPGNRRGGGEWPDPAAPPSDAAPGSAGMGPQRSGGPAQFKDPLDEEREESLRRRA